MNIKRELAILKGNLNKKINQDFLDDNRETSEEDDYLQLKGQGESGEDFFKISKDQMQQLLFQINYLPFLKNQDKYNVESKVILESQKAGHGSNFKDEIRQAHTFVNYFWQFLNPKNTEKIRRYDFYKMMKILMLSIGKVSESEIHTKLAQFLADHYRKQSINLKVPKHIQEEEVQNLQKFSFNNQHEDNDGMKVIEERDDEVNTTQKMQDEMLKNTNESVEV